MGKEGSSAPVFDSGLYSFHPSLFAELYTCRVHSFLHLHRSLSLGRSETPFPPTCPSSCPAPLSSLL